MVVYDAANVLWFLPVWNRVGAPQTGSETDLETCQVADYGRLRGVSIHPEK
jgi:hypothetical protein